MVTMDQTYYLQKFLQGIHHYQLLGGNDETIIPKAFKDTADAIIDYIQLNHNNTTCDEINEKAHNLTDTYFKNLTEASKDAWLSQSVNAIYKLRAMNLNENEITTAYIAAANNLINRVGKKIKTTLDELWYLLPDYLPVKRSYSQVVQTPHQPDNEYNREPQWQYDQRRADHNNHERYHNRHLHGDRSQSRNRQHHNNNQARLSNSRSQRGNRHRQHADTYQHRRDDRRNPYQWQQTPTRRDRRHISQEVPRTARREEVDPNNEEQQRTRAARREEEEPIDEGKSHKYPTFYNYVQTMFTQEEVTFPNDLYGSTLEARNVQGSDDVLSNFYATKITFKNKTFSSNEQLYQFLKAVHCEDDITADQILKEKDPRVIKRLGNLLNRNNPGKIQQWDKIKLNIMLDLIKHKVKSSQLFKDRLIYSFPRQITHNVYDKFWGAGYRNKGRYVKGQDNFSKVLMCVRKDLINEWEEEIAAAVRHNVNHQNAAANAEVPHDSTMPAEADRVTHYPTLPPPSPAAQTELINSQPETSTEETNDELPLTQYHTPLRASTPAAEVNTDSSGDITDSQFAAIHLDDNPPPQPQRFRVLGAQSWSYPQPKHEWKLPVMTQKVVILGDSNIQTISETPMDQYSIETHSYPGARPSHFTDMFTASPSPDLQETEYVILSVGINSRNNLVTYNKQQITKMIKAFKQWSPQTKKAVAIVQISGKCTPYEKVTMEKFNEDLAEAASKAKIRFLPLIAQKQFITGKDNVHWTKQTANKIVLEWFKAINFHQPCPPEPPR